jgi:hypothetical protein
MTTAIAICNLALGHIGRASINALDEKSSEARECAKFYEHARDTLIERSMWTFARRRAALAQVVNDAPERWAYAYALPGDSTGILYIVPEFDVRNNPLPIDFEVKSGRLYTNVSPAIAEYKIDVTDPSKFSAMFIDALSFHLASYLARPLTKSSRLVQEMKQEATTAISLAVTHDAAQDVQRYAFDADSIVIRN